MKTRMNKLVAILVMSLTGVVGTNASMAENFPSDAQKLSMNEFATQLQNSGGTFTSVQFTRAPSLSSVSGKPLVEKIPPSSSGPNSEAEKVVNTLFDRAISNNAPPGFKDTGNATCLINGSSVSVNFFRSDRDIAAYFLTQQMLSDPSADKKYTISYHSPIICTLKRDLVLEGSTDNGATAIIKKHSTVTYSDNPINISFDPVATPSTPTFQTPTN